jgi:hypothetical protein
MNWLDIVKTVVLTFGVPYLAHKFGGYASTQDRKYKVNLASTVVQGVIHVILIQKGMATATADMFTELVQAAETALLAQGFSAANAKAVAEREVATQIHYNLPPSTPATLPA